MGQGVLKMSLMSCLKLLYDIIEFKSAIKNIFENRRRSAEIPCKRRNIAIFRGNRLNVTLIAKISQFCPEGISLQLNFLFYQKDLILFLLKKLFKKIKNKTQ